MFSIVNMPPIVVMEIIATGSPIGSRRTVSALYRSSISTAIVVPLAVIGKRTGLASPPCPPRPRTPPAPRRVVSRASGPGSRVRSFLVAVPSLLKVGSILLVAAVRAATVSVVLHGRTPRVAVPLAAPFSPLFTLSALISGISFEAAVIAAGAMRPLCSSPVVVVCVPVSSTLLILDSVAHKSPLTSGKRLQPGRRSVRGNCLCVSGAAKAAVAHTSTVSIAVSVAVGSSCSLVDGLLDLFSTGSWGYTLLDRKAQGGAKGILLGLFDPSYLFGPQLLLTLGVVIISFGIPR